MYTSLNLSERSWTGSCIKCSETRLVMRATPWTMLCFLLICLVMFWVVLIIDNVTADPICATPEYQQHFQPRDVARGYYSGVGYPTYLPYMEPLTILASLAFLAFLVQTFHTVYNMNNNNGLLGNLLTTLLGSPPKHRKLTPRYNPEILRAIEYYDFLNTKKRKKKKPSTFGLNARKNTSQLIKESFVPLPIWKLFKNVTAGVEN